MKAINLTLHEWYIDKKDDFLKGDDDAAKTLSTSQLVDIIRDLQKQLARYQIDHNQLYDDSGIEIAESEQEDEDELEELNETK